MSAKERGDSVALLREHVERHPQDAGARLRLASLMVARGERAAARGLLEQIEAGGVDTLAGQATSELAAMDEAEGRLLWARARWERLCADDIDHPEARARLLRLRSVQGVPVLTSSAGAPPTIASPEGVTLLRYELVRELGRGATSTVYLARDHALGIALALKILHPQLAAANRSEACQRFFHEARVAAALRHPGVVAIYDIDEAARALAMEHLAGGALRDRLRMPGTMATGEVLATAGSLLRALGYLHARGVVHGDITPRNVLLRAPGDAVLADFGNARLVGRAEAEPAAGTPIYIAPEQFRGAPPSAATDLFAVGALVWELLVGHAMRAHSDLVANRFTARSIPVAALGGRGRDGDRLAALVAALTASEPDARPPSAQAALAALES